MSLYSPKLTFTALTILLLCVFCSSCEKEPYDRIDFIAIEITDIEALSIDSVLVKGEVKDLGNLSGVVESYGILWSTSDEALSIESFEVNERLGALSGVETDGKFEKKMKLEPNRKFLIRAYATADNDRYFYSEIINYETGIGKVETQEAIYHGGFILKLQGGLTGVLPNLTVIEHGFCWSTINSEPDIESDTIQMGSLDEDNLFTGNISLNVELDGSPYYYRAYAIYKNSASETVVYGEVMTFDGDMNYWVPVANDFPGLACTRSATFTIGDKAYLGAGAPNTDGTPDEFWEFDPITENWTQKSGVPFIQNEPDETRRIDALAFSVDTLINGISYKYGFIGTGSVRANAGRPADFWRYDVEDDTWTSINSPSNLELTRGVSFTIGHYGYVGLGEWFAYLLDDFWRYNMVSNSWETVALFEGPARTEAFAFSIGSKGYVGGGRTRDDLIFYDFYEYDPENNSWTIKSGLPREFIVANTFSLNGKGYVTTSVSPDGNFWEYDPDMDEWNRRADLPGNVDATFTINGVAYAGSGYLEGVPNKGFYRYVP